MANTRKKQLAKARSKQDAKGETWADRMRGPNTGAWEYIRQGMHRPAQSEGWSRGYDGPGKGTW